MMSHGAWGLLVSAIMGMTVLSLHFLGSMWSSVRNVPLSFLLDPIFPATASIVSSGMFRKNFTTTTPLATRYLSKFLHSLSSASVDPPSAASAITLEYQERS